VKIKAILGCYAEISPACRSASRVGFSQSSLRSRLSAQFGKGILKLQPGHVLPLFIDDMAGGAHPILGSQSDARPFRPEARTTTGEFEGKQFPGRGPVAYPAPLMWPVRFILEWRSRFGRHLRRERWSWAYRDFSYVSRSAAAITVRTTRNRAGTLRSGDLFGNESS